jgi:DNA segregation ATPase FtsK/SpoIIIE-like protein
MKFFDYFKKIFFTFISILTGALILVSILSYNHSDPTFFYDTSEPVVINNLAGGLGANLAAILLYIFGLPAILLVFVFAFFAIIAFGVTNFKNEWDRIVGLFVLVLASSILSRLIGFEFFKSVSPGGFVGFFVVKNLELKDPIYPYLLVYSMLSCSLVLIFRFAWISRFKLNFNILKYLGIYGYLESLKYKIKDIYGSGWDYSYLFWNKVYLKTQDDSTKVAANIKDVLIAAQEIASNKTTDFLGAIQQNFSGNMGINSPVGDNSFGENLKDNNKLEKINFDFDGSDLSLDKNFDENFLDSEKKDYVLPDTTLLDVPAQTFTNLIAIERESEKRAAVLQEKLECFGINGKIRTVTVGPVVTLFEYQPSLDTKISNILARENDLHRFLENLLSDLKSQI